MKPTDKEIEKFWELCGFYKFCSFWYSPTRTGSICDWARRELPLVDLEHIGLLFKYAVPKIWSLHWITFDQAGVIIEQHETAESEAIQTRGEGDDPALALFWAIYKVLGGKE